METFAQQFFNLLVSPPGNLIYHLVLAFSITASIQAALGKHIRLARPRLRLVIGLSILLFGQIILFFCSGLAWQGMVNSRIFLPPLDRALALFSLVWIFWLWAFPEKTRFSDIFIGFASLLIFILFLLTTGIWYNQPANIPFNNSWWDWIWGLAAIVFMVGSMVYFILQRPPTWGMGLGVISVNLVGYVAHLTLMPPTGDYAPLLRLAHICSFPLLPTLAQRLYELNPPIPPTPATVTPAPRISTIDFSILRAWTDFATQEDAQSLCSSFSRALAVTLKAEISILIGFDTTTNILQIDCGYNLIKDKPLGKQTLKTEQVPLLMNCIRRNAISLIKFNETNKFNLQGIGPILELSEPMDILFFPLPPDDSRAIKALLLLNPENKRLWNDDELMQLQSMREDFANLLYQIPSQSTPEREKSEPNQAEIDQLNQVIANLENQNRQMEEELDQLSTQYLNQQQENETLKTKFSQLQQDLLFLSSQLSTETSSEEKRPQPNQEETAETSFSAKVNLDELQQENFKLQSQIEQLLKENTRLQELLDKLQIPDHEEFSQKEKVELAQGQDDQFEALIRKMQMQTDRLESADAKLMEQSVPSSIGKKPSFFEDLEPHEDEIEWELPSFMEPSAKEKTQPIKIRRSDTPSLPDAEKHLEKLISNLKMENEMLFARLRETQQLNAADSTALENLNLELQQALERISQLDTELQAANQRIATLRQTGGGTIFTSAEKFESINSILSELEDPMSSMNGYMDMLLSDNIGKLGAVHKRLVERMKASYERISQLLGQLLMVRSTVTDIQPGILNAKGINDLVNQSLTALETAIKQKQIILETNIQETFPPIDLSKVSELISMTLQVWIKRTGANSQGLINAGVINDDGSRIFFFEVKGMTGSPIDDEESEDILEIKTYLDQQNGQLTIVTEQDGTNTLKITLPVPS